MEANRNKRFLKEDSKQAAGSGVVEFEDFNKLKKKTVRGLLRKRAKKYECM